VLLPAVHHELGSDNRHRDTTCDDLEGTLRILRDLKAPSTPIERDRDVLG